MAVYNWTGCYIGGNAGYGRAADRAAQTRQGCRRCYRFGRTMTGASDDSASLVAARLGCNYQVGQLVLGLEGKVDFGDIRSSHGVPTAFPGFPPPTSFTSTNRTKNVATATARAGYLFDRQRCWPTSKAAAPGPRPNIPSSAMFPSTSSRNWPTSRRQGWTVGGGLEWMVAPNWSVFGEYNYMDFGRKDISLCRRSCQRLGAADIGAPA